MSKTVSSPIEVVDMLGFEEILGATCLHVGQVEMLRFEDNGEIYVRGEKVDDNKEVYKAVLEWLYSDKQEK